MPVLIIAAAFLLIFLVMGVMSAFAVASELRLQRRTEDQKQTAGPSLTPRAPTAKAKTAAVAR